MRAWAPSLAYACGPRVALNRARGVWVICDRSRRISDRSDDHGHEVGRATNRRAAIRIVKDTAP